MTTTATSTRTQTSIRTFRTIHAALRRDSARLAEWAAEAAAGQATSRKRREAVATYAVKFLDTLDHHHHVEDDFIFPALDRIAANETVTATFARLAADHDELELVIERMRQAYEQLAIRELDASAAQAHAADTARLVELLLAHLEIEEALIFPILDEQVSPEEWEVIDRPAKKLSPARLMFLVPWFVSAATLEDARVVLAEAPAPMRLLFRLSRGRYDRLARRAFETGPSFTVVDAVR